MYLTTHYGARFLDICHRFRVGSAYNPLEEDPTKERRAVGIAIHPQSKVSFLMARGTPTHKIYAARITGEGITSAWEGDGTASGLADELQAAIVRNDPSVYLIAGLSTNVARQLHILLDVLETPMGPEEAMTRLRLNEVSSYETDNGLMTMWRKARKAESFFTRPKQTTPELPYMSVDEAKAFLKQTDEERGA